MELVESSRERRDDPFADVQRLGRDVASAEPLDSLVTSPPLQANRDRPVDDRVRQRVADTGERLRAEDREVLELRHLRTAHPQDVRAAPVAGVQHAAEVFAVARLLAKDRVDLIEQECRRGCVFPADGPEQCGVAMFAVTSGAFTRSSSTSSSSVLPLRFSALVMATYGVASAESIMCVCATHRAIASACTGVITTNLRMKMTRSSSSCAPS